MKINSYKAELQNKWSPFLYHLRVLETGSIDCAMYSSHPVSMEQTDRQTDICGYRAALVASEMTLLRGYKQFNLSWQHKRYYQFNWSCLHYTEYLNPIFLSKSSHTYTEIRIFAIFLPSDANFLTGCFHAAKGDYYFPVRQCSNLAM